MEEFIQKYGGYIIGILLFFLEFVIWHIVKGTFKSSKHKDITTKFKQKGDDEKNEKIKNK